LEQATQILAIVAIIIAVAAGIGLVLVIRLLRRYQRNQRLVLGSRGTVDIVEHVAAVDEKMANVRVALEDLTLAVRDHDVRIDSTLSRVGIVRFDAYQDLGGRQSTAVAFLNSLSDGVVITTVVSRDFARMYVKLIKDGEPDIPLAPEEIEAVEQAKGSGPFTIRPRVEAGIEPEAPGDLPAELASSEIVSAGLPGKRPPSEREVARENRRRRRHGLPPVEEAVMASAVGWEASQTPSPQEISLAEQFVLLRRRDSRGAKTDTGAPDLPGPGDERENGDEL
jgi:hypothetical protein